jgi:aspartate kinase
MALIVQKYGGTSVGSAERIKNVARRVVATADAGNQVCVVVSAMGKTTDELIDLAGQLSPTPHAREMDMLLTAGERISMALLSIAIIDLGHEAVSFTGSQAGILTDTTHGKARILEIKPGRVVEALEDGKITIVAGFQGVSTAKDVTTLGRGGSDATAVALAAALKADACEVYTDVDGVYTADPRIVPNARKLEKISFEEMLELATTGARVMMSRSVELGRNDGVRIHVRSSLTGNEGTWIVSEEEIVEKPIIAGVAHDASESKITLSRVPDRPGIAARIFRALADAEINVDMIVQNSSLDGKTDISFTIPDSDMVRADPILGALSKEIGADGVRSLEPVGKVSLVGAGMRTNPGVAADMFDALSEAGVNIEIISTSPIRISCVVQRDRLVDAVRAVHDKFNLAG